MYSGKRRLCISMAFFFLLCTPLAVRAQLSGQDRQAAAKMIAGTLYLRLHTPCKFGTGQWGAGLGSVLEVSPTTHDVQRKLALPRTSRRESTYWGFFPNQAVHYGKLSYEDGAIQIWMEGVKPNDAELQIDFIQINSLDDFTKAFNQTFSKVPLQDEHPEWPAEVRAAIAERKVIAGMTKEQAYDVVGDPVSVTTGVESGANVETWLTHQETGATIGGRLHRSTHTGFPKSLKFVDGKLQVIQ